MKKTVDVVPMSPSLAAALADIEAKRKAAEEAKSKLNESFSRYEITEAISERVREAQRLLNEASKLSEAIDVTFRFYYYEDKSPDEAAETWMPSSSNC